MKKVYDNNGIPFSEEADIETREYLIKYLRYTVATILGEANKAWNLYRIESPSLIPRHMISKEYSADDYFDVVSSTELEFSLRPETTAASYAYASQLNDNQSFTPPSVVWQAAKSFRNENDQVSKNMRYKEFYQLEFQCLYTKETKNDYYSAVLEPLSKEVAKLVKLDTRLVESDRLPSYSLKTMDIEVDTGHKWLEVCSISQRQDVPFEWNGKLLANVEIAFGLDRLVNVVRGNM